MGSPQPFQILKMDRSRGNIVVSRRAVLEETRAEQRSELVANLKEGQVLQGVVKNITDYGAFVDLGGVDGLLHVTDISWKRINHPTESLSIGQQVEVQVIRFNAETQRISLGMKQLEADPWEGVTAKYPVGTKFTGRSPTSPTTAPSSNWSRASRAGARLGDELDQKERPPRQDRLHLPGSRGHGAGCRRTETPDQRWASSNAAPIPGKPSRRTHPVGSELEGEIKNITEFGLFIGLPGDIDGMIHLSDLSWEMSRRRGGQGVQQGPGREGQGARRRCRIRSGSLSASSS